MIKQLTIIAFAFISNAIAQETPTPHSTEKPFVENGAWNDFTGKQGKASVSLSFYLPTDSQSLTGNYCYNKYDERIQLSGTLSGDVIQLTESYKGKVTGKFSGKLIGGDYPKFKGVWENASGDKHIDFELDSTSVVWGSLNSRYSSNMSDVEVESFMKKVKTSIIENDMDWLASHTTFPIKVNLNGSEKRTTIKNKQQFKAKFTAIFQDEFKNKVKSVSTCNMFSNSQGVMLGSGLIWSGGDSITAINN